MATTTFFSLEKLGTSIVRGTDGQFAYAENPATVGFGNGGFVTAVDDFGASSERVIFEFSNGAGLATSRYAIGGFSDPTMARLSDGLVAAVGTGSDGKLYCRKLDQGSSSLLSNLGPGRNADVAANRLYSGYAVAYESPLDNGYSIVTLHIDRSNHGTDAFSINLSNLSGGPVVDCNPSVARLDNGNYVVAWDRTDANGSSAIWYGIYTSSGGVVKEAAQYDAVYTHNSRPSVSAYGTGFTITYEDDESSFRQNIAVFTQSGDNRSATYGRYDPPGGGPAADPDTTIVGGLAVTAFSSGVLYGDEVVSNDVYLGLSDPFTGARLTDSDNLMLVAEYAGQASVAEIAPLTGRLVISYYDEAGGNVQQQLVRLRETITGDASNQVLYGKYSVAVTIDGGGGNDRLIEGSGDDRLLGNSGDDILQADVSVKREESGDDLFDGGAGTDTLYFSGGPYSELRGATVSLAVTGRQNTGFGMDTIVRIENLTGSAYGADRLTGNSGANVLDDGGKGLYMADGFKDTLTGGLGNDTYIVTDSFDIVVEAANAGTDLVKSRAASFSLSANVENLTLLAEAGNATATGNGLANTLTGNSGSNVLNGGSGADTMNGGAGNDIYYVDNKDDVIVEAAGAGSTDRVAANVSFTLAAGVGVERLNTTSVKGTGSINLVGNAFAQTIIGNAGTNVLAGGAGNDTLTGGGGNDTFAFNTGLSASTNVDVVTDFRNQSGNNDRFLVDDGIFAGIKGNAAKNGELLSGFFKNLAVAAQDANDRIVYNQGSGELFYDANGLTAGGQTLFAKVTPGTVLTYHDFFVN